MGMMCSSCSRPSQQTEVNRKRSQAAPSGETQKMTAAAPERHHAKKELQAQELVPQRQLLQGEECLATAVERQMDQDLWTTRAGDQRFQLTWGVIITMQRCEARDAFLAGIAAHNHGDGLSSGFQKQHRVVPPALKEEK